MKTINNNISILDNIVAIIDKDVPLISNLANLSYVLKFYFKNTDWAGFYLMKNNVLYLGPFQGDLACTVISLNTGVCGKSAYLKQSILVPNVHEFEGHIACSSSTNSELVVTIIKDEKVKVLNLEKENDLLNKIADVIKDIIKK